MKRINFSVEDEFHRRLKGHAVSRGVTMRGLIVEVLEGYFNECKRVKEGEELSGGERVEEVLRVSS